MKQVIPFLVIASHFIFSSCLNDLPETISSEIEMNTTLAFPIGEASLGLDEISGFDDSLLDTNSFGDPYWTLFEVVDLSYSMPFDLGDIYQTSEEIVELTFRLNIYNGFPANVRVQLYFQDEYFFFADSLFHTGPVFLDKAKANSSGKILSRTYEKKDIALSPERIEKLQWVNTVRVYVVFSTNGIDPDLVEFYDEYSVDVQMGVKATLKLNP